VKCGACHSLDNNINWTFVQKMKKKKEKLIVARRKWTIKPITKIKGSDRAYNRRKLKNLED
jgi:hypothetical protein